MQVTDERNDRRAYAARERSFFFGEGNVDPFSSGTKFHPDEHDEWTFIEGFDGRTRCARRERIEVEGVDERHGKWKGEGDC